MASGRVLWVGDHPVASFFAGATAFTWIVSAMYMEEGWTPWILIYVGSFEPAVSAAVVTWLRGDDVRAWAHQIVTAVATVTATQLAVQLLVVVAIVAYFGRESLARGEIPGPAYLRGEDR